MLPSRDPAPAAPSADYAVVLPPSEKPWPAPPSASVFSQTRAERIRASTSAGGLDSVPAGFDDARGDWQVIEAASPFERLYLDAAQYARITPKIVQKNYGILRDFWNDKIAAMQTGAAKTQILLKYGGVHRNEEQVRSYPRELKKAAEKLLAPNGIRICHDELETERRAVARARVEPLMDLILVDDSLEPAETKGFFRQAVAAGLQLEEAAQLLHETILQRDFHPVAQPEGDTLPAQLGSVQWLSRARMERVEAAPAPKPVLATPPPPPLATSSPALTMPSPTPWPGWMRAEAIPIVILLAAGLVAIASLHDGGTTTPAPAPSPAPTITATASTSSAPPVPTTIVHSPNAEQRSKKPRTDSAVSEVKRLKEAAKEAERRRQEAAEQEAKATATREAERMTNLRTDVGDGLKRGGDALVAGDYITMRSIILDARTRAAAEPQIFAAEIVEMDHMLGVAAARETQEVIYRTRLKEIDDLIGDKKYVEAKTLATNFLKDLGLPNAVADHARASLAMAQEALQKSSTNWLKSITTRRTNKGGGNR
jgi:hypothetical protein